MIGRRELIGGIVGCIGTATAGTALLTERASADVSAAFAIDGDDATSDDGRLTRLTVSIRGGEATYDGLDADADTVTVTVYASTGDSPVVDRDNRLTSVTRSVRTSKTLDTRAGLLSFSFDDVDVLSSAGVEERAFRAGTDGESAATDVRFALRVVVADSGGAPLLTETSTTRATVTVHNESEHGTVSGEGGVDAGGPNQRPGEGKGTGG